MTTPSPASLPPLLQPWAGWLALFPDDLAATLGQLLLRLQPLVGPLRRHAARVAVEPAGVGDIVRRGSYERLLLSEWAMADGAPDEFLRRAANNELLFTGPEPANSETSLRSVVLFDAGPAQLGEPRLAHLALFILLARRAELAGAEFQWGILQQPGVLCDALGADGVRRLLAARTCGVIDDAGLAEWNAVLGEAARDCWLIGDPATPCPAQARSRVLIRRSWFEPQLEVELVQRRRSVSVVLPLPAPADGVRLLRRPFDRPAAGASLMTGKAHSLKRPPLFGQTREWLALSMADRSVTLYQIPDTPHAKPGRPRRLAPPNPDTIVAAGLHRKSLGTIAMIQGELHFAGFPGPIFNRLTLPRPDTDEFRLVPGTRYWAPAFYWRTVGPGGATEEVLMLDKAGRMGRWTCSRAPGHPVSETAFRVLPETVIGAFQQGDRLLFAVAGKGRTDIYSFIKGQPGREHLYPIMHEGQQLLFGEPKTWRGGRGTWALRLDDCEWLVGDATGADRIVVNENNVVLGCVRMQNHQASRPGLVVLHADRKRITLLSGGDAHRVLLNSAEPIAQVSLDPVYGRLAWLGQQSGTLTVRAIDAQEPLLRVASKDET